MNTIPRLVFFGLVTASFASAATTDKIIQWPIPDPNAPGMGFQEQKEMLPEMAAHHTEMAGKLLKAVTQNDHAAFLFRGTPAFQKTESKGFALLVSKWSDRLKDGFRMSPVGELRRGHATSLWRVQFVAGGDEALVVLATDKRGSIVTFQFL